MADFPSQNQANWREPLLTWLLESHKEDGSLKDDVQDILDNAIIKSGVTKSTPVNGDKLLLFDSASGESVKELTLATLILNYLDTRYYASSSVDALVSGLSASLDGRQPIPPMLSGGSYDTISHGLGRGSTPAGTSIPANTLILTPIDFPANCTVDQMQLNVTTLAESGLARVGLFDFDRVTATATLLADFGQQATTSTGVKTFSGSVSITKGRRWIGVLLNASTGITVHLPAQSLYFISHSSQGCGYSKGVTFGAFASSYTTVTGSLNVVPMVSVRVA